MKKIFDGSRIIAILIVNFLMTLVVFHSNKRSLNLIQTSPSDFIAKKVHFYSLSLTKIFIVTCVLVMLYILLLEGIRFIFRRFPFPSSTKDHT